jgi:hypothetical protein
LVSPNICSQLETSRKPVPEEFGFGMAMWPLYCTWVRSDQDFGAVRPFFLASTVLKQIAATQASIPVQ